MIPNSAAAYTVDYGVEAAVVTAPPMILIPSSSAGSPLGWPPGPQKDYPANAPG